MAIDPQSQPVLVGIFTYFVFDVFGFSGVWKR
jgi:hypothetical protein